jgi:hypothetical protein
MSFARCHFRAQKSLDFQGTSPSNGPCNGFSPIKGVWEELHFVYLLRMITPPPPHRYKVYLLHTAPPLDGDRSIPWLLIGVGPENRGNLEITAICKVLKKRLRYIKIACMFASGLGNNHAINMK